MSAFVSIQEARHDTTSVSWHLNEKWAGKLLSFGPWEMYVQGAMGDGIMSEQHNVTQKNEVW